MWQLCLVSFVNQCTRGIKATMIDPHHPCVKSEADHSALQMAKQHAAVCIRLLGRCSSDGLGESLRTGLIAVCEEVHLTVPVPTEPPPAGKHDTWNTNEHTHTQGDIQKHTHRQTTS